MRRLWKISKALLVALAVVWLIATCPATGGYHLGCDPQTGPQMTRTWFGIQFCKAGEKE